MRPHSSKCEVGLDVLWGEDGDGLRRRGVPCIHSPTAKKFNQFKYRINSCTLLSLKQYKNMNHMTVARQYIVT